jgi:delta-aminolevulinic acid dehydratase/porphobilinogen synthase
MRFCFSEYLILKDESRFARLRGKGIVQKATREIKRNFPEMLVITMFVCANTLRTGIAA